MITITIISPTRALVEGDYNEMALDDHFAFQKSKFWYKSRAAKAGQWDGKTRLFNRESRTIPIGLVRDTRKWFKERGHKVNIVDERSPNDLTPLDKTPQLGGGIELRDYQEDAIAKALKKERGIIHGATGCGKSEVAAGLIKRLASSDWPVTLFLTGRKSLAKQTRERFALRLQVPLKDIGFIQGGVWEDGRLPVYVAVVDTFVQKQHEIKRRALNSCCQLLFLDEAHHAGSTTWYQTAMRCKARYRFGLTGTPVGRSDFGDLYLRACCGGIIARIKSQTLIQQGLLAKPIIYFTEIRKPKYISGPNDPWFETYNACIVKNKYRNAIIVRYAKGLQKIRMKTLVLVREIQHGQALEKQIPLSFFVNGSTQPSVLDQALNLFTCGDLDTLIATGIFDEGIDIPVIGALIVASGGKSTITTLQRIGRGLRQKKHSNRLFVFDFYDHTNSYLTEHAKRRYTVCKQELFEPTILKRMGSIPDLVGR